MKFGKDFRNHLEETLPDWRDKFLPYKPLKRIIKHLPSDEPAAAAPAAADGFMRILDDELEKLNDFYVDKEEEFVIRFQELKERIDKIRTSTEPSTSKSEFSEEMLDILKAFVKIHGEMVLLKNYSSLNFAALVKILKKYDKRTGALLSLPFTQRALHQPFFTTEPLTRLVHECEANLELLLPLEAEVVETNQPEKPETQAKIHNHLTSSVQEGTTEVYRSTLAAMKAIQDLRKASSTYNPLSLAQYFRHKDEEDEFGAVTSDNFVSNSASHHQGGDSESACSCD